MRSSGLLYNVSQCVLNVVILYNFLHCSAFDMCLLNYLLTYLHCDEKIRCLFYWDTLYNLRQQAYPCIQKVSIECTKMKLRGQTTYIQTDRPRYGNICRGTQFGLSLEKVIK